jgi:hypothetical protein
VRHAPDLEFTGYFRQHNHVHNIDEGDVVDAYFGRRVQFSKLYKHDGKPRREILAKNDDTYMVIFVQPVDRNGEEVWQVLTALPANEEQKKQAKRLRVGDFTDEQ